MVFVSHISYNVVQYMSYAITISALYATKAIYIDGFPLIELLRSSIDLLSWMLCTFLPSVTLQQSSGTASLNLHHTPKKIPLLFLFANAA